MEKKDTRRNLGSYSVDHRLLHNLEDFIYTKIPRILDSEHPPLRFFNHTRLHLVGIKDSTVYAPASTYTGTQFPNDLHVLRIELLYADENGQAGSRAIALILRLGSNCDDSELSIALQAENAKEKIRLIEEGLLAVLEPDRNANKVAYPNEFTPTFLFVIGFFIGIGALMFTQPILRALCLTLFGVAVYFVARRFSKGYCSFESRRQRRIDIFFRWFTTAIAIFVFAAALIAMLQKS